MERAVLFTFMGNEYECNVFIDGAPDPCFVFAILLDPNLIKMFGTDITIRTDFEQMLPMKDDHFRLTQLREGIFNASKTIPEFIAAKQKMAALIAKGYTIANLFFA